jgi:predicted nucleotidyltransferase
MKRKDIKNTIIEYFFVNPTAKLRVREIERTLNLPLPSVINYTKALVNEKILKITRIGKVTLFSADRSSKEYLLQKKLFNIRKVYDSGLIKHLIANYSNPTILLFGSYSKGEDIEDSDIDLYIETASKQEFNLKKYEKALKRKIQVFNFKNIKQVKNIFLANNMLNGITLNNFIEVFK